MIKYITKDVPQEFTDEITCNICGKSVKSNSKWSTPLFHNMDASFEYGSEHDGEYWEFDFCEECLLELVKKFKVPVSVRFNDVD